MKKKILFIIPDLSAAGGEKSLVNLLQQIDYSKYSVDLFLIKMNGLFLKYVPNEVNILDTPYNLNIFNKSVKKSVFKFLLEGKFSLAYSRIAFCIINRIMKNKGKAEQYSWKYLSKSINKINKKYDVAIGFLEKQSNYLCIDNINAKTKIGWIHNDYYMLDLDKKFDKNYFEKFKYIVTVSDKCLDSLIKNFPEYEDKFKLIYNIISPKMICKLAEEEVTDINFDRNYTNIVSIGRLSYQKSFELAIEAAKLIKEKGLKIKWLIIGEGEERESLQKLIDDNELSNEVKLIGLKDNPYKYVRRSDIYVQTSRFEGKAIAIDEAKSLCKPIITTNYTTAKDQINNEKNGLIVDMNSNSIADGIIRLINNENLKNKFIKNLSNENIATEDEINKFYKLIIE